MIIGVISDTHIPDRAKEIPKPIMEAFKNVDMVIHAGDLVDGCVLKELKTVCKKVIAVRGNMDPIELHDKLPQKEIVEAGGVRIGVMHGYGNPNKLMELTANEFKNSKVNIIIFGHSHKPVNEKIDNILFFNPGSATDKIFSPFNSYGIIEVNGDIKAKIVKI